MSPAVFEPAIPANQFFISSSPRIFIVIFKQKTSDGVYFVYILLIVHLSIILVINQLNAQILVL